MRHLLLVTVENPHDPKPWNGTGYVGLVTDICLAEVGNMILCLNPDVAKIQTLKEGGIPIHDALG